MNDNMISFRYADYTEQELQEIARYLNSQTWVVINRSDAIRYAIYRTAMLIRQERQEQKVPE